MDKRTITGLLLALLLITAAVCVFFMQETENHCVFPVMGTVCECRFTMNPKQFDSAIQEVRTAFEQVMATANLHDKNSELSRLNASAHLKPFVCSSELYYLLSKSREAYKISGGLFDISIKPLMDLWGFYRKTKNAPDSGTIADTQKLCGLDKVVFNDTDRSVFFPVKGMAFDLGGIAKGYALDVAARRMDERKISVTRGILNLGGNLRLFGKNQSYNIGIKDPTDPAKTREYITLTSPGAVSSSGDYERYVIIGNNRYGHIIDPLTGMPAVRNHAATVFSATGIDSDWMSTVLFLGGESIKNKLDCTSRIVEK